jgi:nucleotide-binding universal stress UspA family protein
MHTSILVPLDGSPFAEQALPAAAALARRMGARLHIVRVHEPPVMPLGSGESIIALDAEWIAALRAEEEEYLRRTANRCMEEYGLVARTDLLAGPSANAIVAAARDSGDALVVMTTHGRGGLSRAWLGSIADAVVRRSPVAVLLIRPDAEAEVAPALEPRRILVPVDGSRLSEGILAAAIAVGRLTGAHYTLLRVVPTSLLAAYPLASTFGMGSEAFEEMRLGAAHYLDELARRTAERYHVEVDTALVAHPIPAEAILEQADARGADMIALATHGRGGWTRMALGSVADKVMRGAKVPVLLYRPPVPVENGGGTREAVHAA